MSRKKLFYPKNEINENLYTPGNEFQLQNGSIYTGLYHRYITTGEIYTNGSWNPKTSVVLTKYEQLTADAKTFKTIKKDIKTKFKTPERYFPKVTSADIQKKIINRYFLYKLNERQITEINEIQYNQYNSGQLDNNIYSVIKIIWNIAGEANNFVKNNINQLGVINKNLNIIRITNRSYPGFSQVINNPLELYVDTTVIVPPDIN